MITIQGLSHIYKKELKTYLVSPVAYVVISAFIFISAFFFFFMYTFFLRNQASMRVFFSLLPVLFVFVIPAITMHLFSEEVNLGSYEMLLTLPLDFLDIIVGKFLAAVTLTAICLAPTLSFGIFISLMGSLDWGPVIGGYLGALLMGAAFCSIGLFVSSITKKQLIALICGWALCFLLWVLDKALMYIPFPKLITGFLQYLGTDIHFQNISKGIIDTRDIVYFLSLCFFALYGTKLVMEEKK